MKLDINFCVVESPGSGSLLRQAVAALDRIAAALEASTPDRAPAKMIVHFGAPTKES